MTINLSVEEVRFLKQAVALALETSKRMVSQGHEASVVAAKAAAVCKNILAKLEDLNPENS